ncbi:hypothetical protein WJX72_005003 [[Myrmecia] bisecta]|uniref:Spindle assembly abnormal protein 6 N-terminal domain-containing protein n=1 Tax=[Myrmecia] bisecta TaxID=41462 RepID=A0AAW1PLB5_9CHLO
MPLVIDNNTKSWESFDVQTASTLYWKAVPVLLQQADREEQTGELTVRILSGVNRNNHNSRILRIHLSSEDDLFFLHTLEVSEEEFQSLKVEQGILVDFANFPGKIIVMLEKCITSKAEDPPRFQAVLQTRGGESVFKIVETNDFKQLAHIMLAFRPGNDPAVKQFLAFRLSEVKANCDKLTEELDLTQNEKQSVEQCLKETEQQLSSTKEAHEKHLMEYQANTKTRDAVALQERTRELNKLKETLDRERAELDKKYRDQLDALNSRNAELDQENRALRDHKYELDTKVSELSHKLGSADGNGRSLEEEVGRLRTQVQQLSRDRSEREVQVSDQRAKLRALEEKVQAQKELLLESNERNKDLEASTRQLEARCSELKEAAAGHEQRAKEAAAEVMKGNRIIEKLTNDLRMAKEKMRRKQAIITRQEEEMLQRDRALEQAGRESTSLAQSLEKLKQEHEHLKAEHANLKTKLEDSKQQLQGNEQMIRWLNNQVNEAQLQYGTAVSGSRYSFRPSSLAPATASAGTAPHLPYRSSVSPVSGLNTGTLNTELTHKYWALLDKSSDRCAAALRMPKVALMFLTRGDMPHERLWSDWFAGGAGLVSLDAVRTLACARQRYLVLDRLQPACSRNASANATILDQQHMFTVYTHPARDFAGYPNASLFHGTDLQNRIATQWGHHSTTEAARRMLQAALKEPLNQRFVLLSESCIPLYPPAMWVALIRKHATAIAEDTVVAASFEEHCTWGADPDWGGKWRDCFSDEHYMSTLLAIYGLDQETDCLGFVAHADWENGEPGYHPVTYEPDDISPELIQKLRMPEICGLPVDSVASAWKGLGTIEDVYLSAPVAYGPVLGYQCPLFARKFPAHTADLLYDLYTRSPTTFTRLDGTRNNNQHDASGMT